MIVRRYEAATGNAAVLVETGETYHELKDHGAAQVATGQGDVRAGV